MLHKEGDVEISTFPPTHITFEYVIIYCEFSCMFLTDHIHTTTYQIMISSRVRSSL